MPINRPPLEWISLILVLLIALPIHEFAHAWTATRFGDSTPRMNGRLTLNPLAHLDPIGSLLLLIAGFGWAKPVPVNPYALEKHSSSALMLVSFAGPFSNFLLALLAAIPIRLGLGNLLPGLSEIIYFFIYINLVLMVFNLIPLAPLDGEKIAIYLLPPNFARIFDSIRPYSPLILMMIFVAGFTLRVNIIYSIIGPPVQALFNLLVG
jgi:Zn-dependent protease